MRKQTMIIVGIAVVLIAAAGVLFFLSGSNSGGGQVQPGEVTPNNGATAPADNKDSASKEPAQPTAPTAPAKTNQPPSADAAVMYINQDKAKLCFIDKSGKGQTFASFGAEIYIPNGANVTVIKKKAGTLKKQTLFAMDDSYLEQLKTDLDSGRVSVGPLVNLLGQDAYQKLLDELDGFGLKSGAFKKLAVASDCLEESKFKTTEPSMEDQMK